MKGRGGVLIVDDDPGICETLSDVLEERGYHVRAFQRARAARARKIRHAPVLDTRGALVGIVSDGDLRQVILDPAMLEEFEDLGKALNLRTLSQVITWEPLTVKPSTGIREAAQLMHSNKIGALPVVDRGRIVGMLTVSDVLKTLVRILNEGVISKPGRWGAEA